MHIVANWKQFLSPEQEVALAQAIFTNTDSFKPHQLTLLPSFLSMREIEKLTSHSNNTIPIGAQDFAISMLLAQTGCIRADYLNAKTGLVGHSERERLNHETTEDFSLKLHVALSLRKKVILCFGEKELVTDDANLLLQLKTQLQIYSDSLGSQSREVTLAYEPQWSIGGTKTASVTIIKKVLSLAQAFGFSEMLYGGSVDAASIKKLAFPELSGFLVGRASTQIDSLMEIFAELNQLSFQ